MTREATGTRSKTPRRKSCCRPKKKRPAESLAGDTGIGGEIADAAYDEGGHTGLMFAPIGRSIVDGIIRFDGTNGNATKW